MRLSKGLIKMSVQGRQGLHFASNTTATNHAAKIVLSSRLRQILQLRAGNLEFLTPEGARKSFSIAT